MTKEMLELVKKVIKKIQYQNKQIEELLKIVQKQEEIIQKITKINKYGV